ncbi:heme o synthase [bacterium]|nr:heme o synthase [bacterium]
MDYLTLTKPRISLLFAITGLAAFIMEGSMMKTPGKMWLLVLAIYMTGGAANALNQYFERDVDAQMARTAKKRPLPQGKISPMSALIFSVVLGAAGTFVLWFFGGWLSALLGIGTIIFYSFYYTLYLKPRTPYNIVIGGVAGATGPLIGWAAATGQIGLAPFIMFLLIFLWTPPHFWALALGCKEDYKKVSYPMLPLVVGDEATRKQILLYSFTLIPTTLALYFIGASGMIYLISTTVMGILFVIAAIHLYRKKTTKSSWGLFAYSIVYLLLVFVAIMVDSLVY